MLQHLYFFCQFTAQISVNMTELKNVASNHGEWMRGRTLVPIKGADKQRHIEKIKSFYHLFNYLLMRTFTRPLSSVSFHFHWLFRSIFPFLCIARPPALSFSSYLCYCCFKHVNAFEVIPNCLSIVEINGKC